MTPKKDYEFIFPSTLLLNGELKGNSVLNYLSSHDDGGPFDKQNNY
jgi:alpha-amylase